MQFFDFNVCTISPVNRSQTEITSWLLLWYIYNILSRNPAAWARSILDFEAGEYFAGRLFAASLRIGSVLAGPVGYILGGATEYALEYIISYATCLRLDNDKDEFQ